MKRGALTQQTLIVLIILIFSAAILFFVLKVIPHKETSEKEACRQSVILRNNVFGRGELLGMGEIPLNCKTQYIKISTTNEETIKREIANAMYDCWWMLGEGKMNFFSSELTKETYCVICSVIEFDEKVQKKVKKIENFQEYLLKTKIPSKNITYLEFFIGPEVHFTEKNLNPTTIFTDQQYIVIYSMVKRDKALEWLGGIVGGIAIVAGVVSLLLTCGASAPLSVYLIAGGAGFVGGWCATDKARDAITKNPSEYWVQFNLIPMNATALKQFGCERLESIP